ncbi:MAG TPA: multidrug export protein EmrA, partial [Steroidobacteraceae bacterium]|nr:multidrug export protein EmrA [Steroidobacteraceae bacterium]
MDATVDTAPTTARQLQQRRRLWLVIVAVALVLAALAITAWWLLYARYYESTDDAYVAGDMVTVMPQVAGTVVAIGADETDLVRAGQMLVRLDATDAR